MKIALCFNIRRTKAETASKKALEEIEFDESSIIIGIVRALKNLGHQVFLVEADEGAYLKFKKLKSKIDLVFNIAEGKKGENREAQIPAILEMLGIPYVGSKPVTHCICLNKALTKTILSFYNIPTSPFQLFKTGKEILRSGLRFPLIVKPNSEGSSKGIFQNSLVKTPLELKRKIKEMLSAYHQPVLAEEFLAGREFTVGLIGNNPTEVLPLVEIDFSGLPSSFVPMESYEVKWVIDQPGSKIQTTICPAKVAQKLGRRIKALCLQTKEVLEALDWCRIDIRLNKKGIPHILEINQIPGIIPDPKQNSRFPLAARTAGYSYEKMLDKIIRVSCKRYKIKC